MIFNEHFRAKVWKQDSAGAWHFVTLTTELSQRIRTLTTGLRRPFGSCRVTARTGLFAWKTSLFIDTKRDAFLLPVKAEVRRKANIKPGDEIEVEITLEL